VFGNHWPSRSGGQFESVGNRDIAGETLSYFFRRALEVHGANAPALAVGDFKDVLLDTFLVRSVLVPTLVELIGPKIWWPSRLAREEEQGGPREPGERLAVEA
jgi:hypothetical protein